MNPDSAQVRGMDVRAGRQDPHQLADRMSMGEESARDRGTRYFNGCQRRLHMGTKQVRIEENVYARIADKKREDETFSEAIDRLISDWSLADWGTGRPQEEIDEHRALIEDIEQAGREEIDDVLAEMDQSE